MICCKQNCTLLCLLCVLPAFLNCSEAAANESLPTLYEYYTSEGVNHGLSIDSPQFTLNGHNITLYSAAIHYFRVPRAYWRDRLRKARAAGVNTVETYVPWNLHEPQPGVFDFGNGSNEMSDMLDIGQFLKIAKEEDLIAIVRPGPFICAEWEFGGLPSWLLREKDITVRTSDPKFMQPVTRYFNQLLSLLAKLQFTKGGPVVALQVENEYASTGTVDKEYLKQLKQLFISNGIVELLVTSDGVSAYEAQGAVEGALITANFAGNPKQEFDTLKRIQPGKPIMAMEYWTGWFDHWSEDHHTRNANDFAKVYEEILSYPASVNMYMFHGGSDFNFMNGANLANGATDNEAFQPDISSYDYDAPLSESGDYTDKYTRLQELLKKYNTVHTKLPALPPEVPKTVYPSITVTHKLPLSKLIAQAPNKIQSESLQPMEYLPINNNSGQSYGYIVYRKENINIPANATLKIEGRVCDTVMVLVNGQLLSKPIKTKDDLNGFGYWRLKDSTLNLGANAVTKATLELVVENWGRNNFGRLTQLKQLKGLWQGNVLINDAVVSDWQIVPLEFRQNWINSLKNWESYNSKANNLGPALYKATLTVKEEPKDTYLDTTGWSKGFFSINGFVIGRHCRIGPPLFLYLPAPYIRKGNNEIIIFEHFNPVNQVQFMKGPKYLS